MLQEAMLGQHAFDLPTMIFSASQRPASVRLCMHIHMDYLQTAGFFILYILFSGLVR